MSTKQSSPEKARQYRLKRMYGLTVEQYNEILAAQGGGCGVCGKTFEEEGRYLAVEHDHQSGEIFGICCWRCNHRLIGKIRDPVLFANAAKFLTKGTGLFVPPKPKRRRKTARKVKIQDDKARNPRPKNPRHGHRD